MHSAAVDYCGGPERPLMPIDITLITTATVPRIWLLRSWLVRPRLIA
jgi:hypothetical protein